MVVLALKGNQETLHQAVIDSIKEQLEGDLGKAREYIATETGHGRDETRVYLQLPAPKSLPRIRDEALRENFAWLNRFTLSLLKQHPDRTSLVMKRRSCGWSENYLLKVVTGATV
jgi:hypothetical protein